MRTKRATLLAATGALALALIAQTGYVPPAYAAAAPPIPRAYQVSSVADSGGGLAAISADGGTSLHLAPASESDSWPKLVATNLATGVDETVGLDLTGAPAPHIITAAISGNGRTVSYVASASNAAELHLPASVDQNITTALFVHDRLSGETRWVPTPTLGVAASLLTLGELSMSEDGNRVAVRITLPLPEYAALTQPQGVLVVTLGGAAPAYRVVGPADLVPPDGDLPTLQPRLRGFTLSGDGTVLAVTARRETTPYLMRFGAADGARLPAE
ncbi:MAG: hypothetical protein HOV79_30225, partial [Hamadaea sp.]|nr:hypothetical protein [Hamadaea sp.]